MRLHTILVPTDFAEHARAEFEHGIALAQLASARIVVLPARTRTGVSPVPRAALAELPLEGGRARRSPRGTRSPRR
jgi:nucleotide-binding universal stress UspA family protein